MSVWQAIIYGLIQGLTEFIPVSSSGHLELLTEVFGFDGSFEHDVLINIGTLIAAVLYFRKRIVTICGDVFVKKDTKTLRNLIISTIPAVVVGFFFIDFFSSDSTRNLVTVITMLALLGIVMVAIDKFASKPKTKEVESKHAITIGLSQVLAFIPGTSRSGSTILAGRASGLDYDTAVEYSFLLGIPVILGAILRVAITEEGVNFVSDNTAAFVAGNVAALISGLLAIHLMMRLTKRIGLKYFGIYRIVLALLLLLFAL